jgi:DNA (cytosine-5)-methyltransferase 1
MELYKMKKLKVLDLFSGLGGFSLGLERTGHFETIAFCDNNKYSKLILDKHWKGIKIYDDVREITKENFETDGIETPDIITGGFPCQPFSVAGKQKGTSDDRHLWPEMFRIIKTFKPRFVIGENVRGIVNIQDGVVFETVCTNLEDEGYEVQPFNIPAASVGAPHRRERIWFIAVREDVGNSEYNGSPTSEIGRGNEKINGGTEERQNKSFELERTSISEDNGNVSKENNENMENSSRTLRLRGQLSEKNENEVGEKNADQLERSSSTSRFNVADTNTRLGNGENEEIQSRGQTSNSSSARETSQGWWSVEPNVGRVAHGVSGRVHRLKGLGNSIVPQIVEEIGKALIKAERTK